MSARMEEWPQPFAAYLLTLSLHHPFEGFPPQHRRLDVGVWEDTPFGNFLHTMHFFDRALEAFMADLERSGLADSTVVAVWGDHDAGFAWSPEVAAAMGVSFDAAGWYLSQEVPFFVRLPDRGEHPAGERTAPGGHVDVAPTLLAQLGIDPAAYGFVGRNLLSGRPNGEPVVGEYGCWRDGRHLYLQGKGTLESGRCLEMPSLREVAVEECADGFDRALRQTEVSRLVLEHDLQVWLHAQLADEGGGTR
jgi:phosphoglycerol transferase MdoB-like AlkP superfamily enzyme